jgi:hypothetical protein
MIDIQTVLTYLTLISVPVGVFYHIMTLNNTRKNQQMQLETRQAQLYNNIWNQSMNNPQFQKNYMRFSSLSWKNIDEYKETFPYGDYESENTMALWSIALFFEGLVPIIKERLLDLKYLEGTVGSLLRDYWLKIEPVVEDVREYYNSPTVFEGAEYLYNELRKRDTL